MKLTGKTVRITGTLSLASAADFFEIEQETLLKAEWLNLSDTWRIHPSGLLPIVAWIQKHQHPLKLRVEDNPWVSRFLTIHGYRQLLTGLREDNVPLAAHCAKHYREDGPAAHKYVTDLLQDILERRHCGHDVAESLEWSSSELIGNVFHHSKSSVGAITHFLLWKKGQATAIFSLVDAGIGILESMREAFPNLTSDAEAIELAMQRGITSKRENQGWGLFGSEAIVRAAGGKLTIWSGSSRLTISPDGARRYDEVPYYTGTVIEWTLPLIANISLAKVLENPHRASSYQLELYEPVLGTIVLTLRDDKVPLRDRAIGKKLRTKLLNLVENSEAKHCVIDFAGIGTITSSFSDEFLGKTAVLLGPNFKSFVSLANVSDVNKAIIEIAIQQRLQSEKAAAGPQFIRSRT